jgi:small subunit ribosomal protein S11
VAKKKVKKKVVLDPNGQAYIKASFNNVLVTITDAYGNALC